MRYAIMAFLSLVAASGYAADASLHAALERIAAQRTYFAHQSVGANILDGVRQLAQAEGVALRIAEQPDAAAIPGGTLAHFFIPENGAPLTKLRNFESALGKGAAVDVALLKFCYVDVDAQTDAKALFERYRSTIDRLRRKNPHTVFVHVTLPLTIEQTGPKAWLKRLMGRAPYGTVENLRREEYNALLRKAYAGREPVFDLARVESTAPDGHFVTVSWQGATAPAMAAEYTEDGGHLNEQGRLKVARELIRVLASARLPPERLQ